MNTPLIWVYVPTDDNLTWQPPAVWEDECPTMADAHYLAKVARQRFPGHLFAVTDGRRPLPVR